MGSTGNAYISAEVSANNTAGHNLFLTAGEVWFAIAVVVRTFLVSCTRRLISAICAVLCPVTNLPLYTSVCHHSRASVLDPLK